MDIAKYIGLYLLKNKFCYLHGLGNLQIHKKPPVVNGDTLSAPGYEISLQSTGSIDDNLANFIATAEQTSIAKASTEIRSFVDNARAELAAGNTVVIPGIGHFAHQNGKTAFVADPNFSYAPTAIPTLKMSQRLEEKPSFKRATPEEEHNNRSGSTLNNTKIWLILLAVAGLIGVIVLVSRFLAKDQAEAPAVPAPVETPAPAAPIDTMAAAPMPADTNTPAMPAPPAASATGMQIVLRSYPTRAAAEKRQRQLKTTPLGESVSLIAQDSAHYLVVIPYAGALSDSTRVLDSLSRVYGSPATLRR